MNRKQFIFVVSVFLAGWFLGVVWHKYWLPPLPQISTLRQSLSHHLSASFRPLTANGRKDFVADEMAGHVRKPAWTVEHVWPEHPKGNIRIVSNELGFREDTETRWEKATGTFRILVTGDSHTDGVVENSESFSNLLEERLNGQGRGAYEVINGGTGLYGPFNYEGFLRKYRGLDPDLFIVTLFAGNDFTDAIRTAKIRGYVHYPDRRPKGYFQTLRAASEIHAGSVAQALNQIFFFEHYPQLIEEAVQLSVLPFKNIQRLCAEEGIELLVLTLPTRVDVTDRPKESEWMPAARRLDLSAVALKRNRDMTRELRSRLDELGIETLDLTPFMEGRGEELFWHYDHHLNHRGHQRVSDVLAEHLRGDKKGTS